jgi:hypothetical protein
VVPVRTRVFFGKPGFFVNDPTVELWIDERLGYRGSFRDGFEVWADLPAGIHTLRSAIAIGPLVRTKHWRLDVPAGTDAEVFAVELSYSRLWGNFKGRPRFAVSTS